MVKIHSYLLTIENLVKRYTLILDYLKRIMESLISVTPDNIQKTITVKIADNLSQVLVFKRVEYDQRIRLKLELFEAFV